MKNDSVDKYLFAIKQDIDYKKFTLSKWADTLPASFSQIPNALLVRKYLAKCPRLFRILLPLVQFVWLVVGLPLYTLLWAMKQFLVLGFKQRIELPETIYLHASSDRYMCFVPDECAKPNAALILPFRRAPLSTWFENVIDLRGVASRKLIFLVVYLTILSAFRMTCSPNRVNILYMYTALNWFWVYLTIKNSSVKSIWISNQIDRWAVLADSLDSVKVTIVQHGNLSQIHTQTGESVFYSMKNKLLNVEAVYVLSKSAIEEFNTAITDSSPRFVVLRPRLIVVPWPAKFVKALRIVIIGSPLVQKALKGLIFLLRSDLSYPLQIAYRPSPRELPFRKWKYGQGVHLLPTNETFPEADIVLDYGSSLTAEILNAMSVRIIYWWPDDPSAKLEVISEIRTFLEDVDLTS